MAFRDEQGRVVAAAGRVGRYWVWLVDEENVPPDGRVVTKHGEILGYRDPRSPLLRSLGHGIAGDPWLLSGPELLSDEHEVISILATVGLDLASPGAGDRSYADQVASHFRALLQTRMAQWARHGKQIEGENEPEDLARQFLDALLPEPDSWSDVGPFLRSETVQLRLNWSQDDLRRGVAEHALLELVTEDGVQIYPLWQFSETGIMGLLPEALSTLAECNLDPWTQAAWLLTENDGASPISVVRAADSQRLSFLLADVRRRFAS